MFIGGSDKLRNVKYAMGLQCCPLKAKVDATARKRGVFRRSDYNLPCGRYECHETGCIGPGSTRGTVELRRSRCLRLALHHEPVLNGVGQPRFNHFPGLYCCSEGGRERLDMFQDSPAAEMFTTTAVCAAFNFQILNPDVV